MELQRWYRVVLFILLILILIVLIRMFTYSPIKRKSLRNKLPSKPILPDTYNQFSYSHYQHLHRPSSNIKHNQTYAYATMMSSTSYLPALEVFLYSFLLHKPQYPLLICIPLVAEHESMIQMVKATASKYEDALSYEIYLLPVVPPPSKGREMERWRINWTKLQLWTIPVYKKLLFIDLDVIIMKNLDHTFDLYSFQRYLGSYDWSKWVPIGSNKINTGVFLAEPSIHTYQYLYNQRDAVHLYNHHEAEQGLFQFLFSEKHCCLPIYYNVQKTVQRYIPSLWSKEAIFILHMTGEKPWSSWSTPSYRLKYVPEHEKKQLIQIDHWDADVYDELHGWWKEYYFQARAKAFQQLTMFQFYEKEEERSNFTLSLPFYRRMKIGDMGKLTLPKRSVVGSFTYFLMIYKSFTEQKTLTLPKFVGVTTSQYRHYTESKEGASIDWTKVQFEADTIYYWHAYPVTSDYYNHLEAHHGELSKVLFDLLDFPLPAIQDKRDHIYGHSVILSRELFLEYTKNATSLLERYQRKYKEENGGREEMISSCLLDYFFNIWIQAKGLKLVYAVDRPSWRRISLKGVLY